MTKAMPKAPTRLDPADPVHSFAREMRGLRLHAGEPSLKELARAMSCSHSTVSAYLNGRRLPPPRQLESFVFACKGNTADWMQRLEAVRDELDRLPAARGSSDTPLEGRDVENETRARIATDRSPSPPEPEAQQTAGPIPTQDQSAAPGNAPLTAAESSQIRQQPEGASRKPARIRRLGRTTNKVGSVIDKSEQDVPSELAAITIVLMDETVPMADRHASIYPKPHASSRALNERITLNLIPVAAASLRHLQRRTRLSQTDLANRAIVSYDFLDAQLQAGHDLIVRDGRTGETRLVRFLGIQ